MMRDHPLAQFEDWWLDEGRPDKMVVATATPDGRPSARYVLFKGFGETGFLFFSSYESRKGRELEANPRAALLFYWGGRQVRIEGRVEKLDADESDAYWATRPAGSKRSAAASHQSRPIGTREELEAAVAAQPDEPARPPHWGGYRVIPDVYEFWIHRDDRLHDRFRYLPVPRSAPAGSGEPTPLDGGWRIERLQP